MQLLDQIEKFDPDQYDLREMLALAAFGKLVKAEYSVRDIEVPDSLVRGLHNIDAHVMAARQDELQARLQRARARFQQDASREERRAQAKDEIDKIEAMLGKTPEAA